MLSRIKALQKSLVAHQAYLLTSPTDIQYFSDFEWLVPAEREAFLLITQSRAYLMYASFSPVKKQPHIELFAGCYPSQVVSHLHKIRTTDYFSTLLVDAEYLFVHEYQAIKTISELEVHNIDRNILWKQRMVKDEDEINNIKKAVEISMAAYDEVIPNLSIGMTEKDVKRLLESSCQKRGAETMAFPTIVAFGTHSALPHYQPSDTKLEENTTILIDFGAKYNNYCADMTRTLWFGDNAPADFIKIEKIVHKAYDAAVAVLDSPDVTAQMIDTAARDIIEAEGYGAQFIHTTGHGVGLDIHEQPSLNWKNTQVIKKNMVITIEPGIYLLDAFGYRYENTIVVT